MDFGMRNWLIAIIVLLIVGVLLDGFRRMRQTRKQAVRFARNMPHSASGDVTGGDGNNVELPNGGARVVDRDGHGGESLVVGSSRIKALSRVEPTFAEDRVTRSAGKATKPEVQKTDNFAFDDYDDDMDPLFASPGAGAAPTAREQDRHEAVEGTSTEAFTAELPDEVGHYEHQGGSEEETYPSEEFPEERHRAAEDEAFETTEFTEESYEPQHLVAESGEEEAEADPDEVLVINVMASQGEQFPGDELQQVALQCGLKFGDMQIFHRYEQQSGDGPLLFSMVNMVIPGTFDLDSMNDFSTPGVSLFMTLPMKSNSMDAFDTMAGTAMAIADRLGGELKDETRSAMTNQTLEHCRQRISEYERRRQLAAR